MVGTLQERAIELQSLWPSRDSEVPNARHCKEPENLPKRNRVVSREMLGRPPPERNFFDCFPAVFISGRRIGNIAVGRRFVNSSFFRLQAIYIYIYIIFPEKNSKFQFEFLARKGSRKAFFSLCSQYVFCKFQRSQWPLFA